ncbi:11183_t:CDS:1 [Ambispora leptoticha]|uniref:11183_t:CDS:1 n=1 Tax=Ambispora leptoticha TaxID=144679 RepID=A0A9N8W2L0_9GLOM|nr:11183_t:CDS:1 [Ambispora leptoticha]
MPSLLKYTLTSGLENVNIETMLGKSHNFRWALVAPSSPQFAGCYNIINQNHYVALHYYKEKEKPIVNDTVDARKLDPDDPCFVWKLQIVINPHSTKKLIAIIPYEFAEKRLTAVDSFNEKIPQIKPNEGKQSQHWHLMYENKPSKL